jgi:hypothetical protein
VPASCEIDESGAFLRAVIGVASDDAIQECYRTITVLCIQHRIRKALITALEGTYDAHFAAVNGIRPAALAGLPDNFMGAFVATTPSVRRVFAMAEQEAAKAGIRVRAFDDESSALSWLLGTA